MLVRLVYGHNNSHFDRSREVSYFIKPKDGYAVLSVTSTNAERSNPFIFNSLRFLHALRLVEMTLINYPFIPNSRTTAESGVIFVRAKAR